MATAVDSPSSSPLGSRTHPAPENGNAFTAGAYPLPAFIPPYPVGPGTDSFTRAAAGMTPGKPAMQTPRRSHKTSKVRSPIAPQPACTSSIYGSEAASLFPNSGAAWPGIGAEYARAAASETAETSLPQQFAQTMNLGVRDWPPSARKLPPPTGAFNQGTPSVTPITAKRSAHRARRPPATAGRTPAAGDSPFMREGSPMDWSPFVTTAAGSQTPSAAQTPSGNMSSVQDGEPMGTRLNFEQRTDVSAATGGPADPSGPQEDDTDGLHVDLAASSLSQEGGGSSRQSSFALEFTARFRFGEAPAAASSATRDASEQPPQHEAATDGSGAQPSAERAAGSARAARSGSSGSSSSGVMNGESIGVRPSGFSRLGNAAADMDNGRRVTRTEAIASHGNGDARFGSADVSASSAVTQAAAQPPRNTTSTAENDRAKANQGSAQPALHAKPVKTPAERTVDNLVHQRADAKRQASASIQDADMPDASPSASSQTRADSNGSAADSAAPFGFTETALPAGVKSRPAEAVKASMPAVPDSAPEKPAAQPAVNGWSRQDVPEETGATGGSRGFQQPFSGLSFSFEGQKATAAGLRSTGNGLPVAAAHTADNDREKHTDAAPEIPQFQAGVAEVKGRNEQASQGQTQAGGSQQAANKPAKGTEGFTLGSFSRLHNRKQRVGAGAAARPRGASSGAQQQTHAAKPEQSQGPDSSAPGSAEPADLSTVWRTYAQQLSEKGPGATGRAVPEGMPAREQASGSSPGRTEIPRVPARGTAQPSAHEGLDTNPFGASFTGTEFGRSWDEGTEKRRHATQEDSLASQFRRQTFGEPDTASRAESAAAETETPSAAAPVAEPEQAPARFGVAPPGASFGLGQAPNAQRATPRRGRGLAARSRPFARSAPQPPAGSTPVAGQASFGFAWPPTAEQPCCKPQEAANFSSQHPGPTAQQQPIFGFQSPQDSDAGQQTRPPAFGSSAPKPSTATPAAAQASSAGASGHSETPPFSFKSPGGKGRAPSEPRAAKPSAAFDWGKPPSGVPSAHPTAPAFSAQPAPFAGTFRADQAVSGGESKPVGSGKAPTSAERKGVKGLARPVRLVVPLAELQAGRRSASHAGSQAGSDAASERQGTPLEDVERLRQRGNSAFQRGSYSRSADLYQRAIDLLRENGITEGLGKLYSNLAASYLQMDKPYAAIAACKSALEAEPSFFRARLRMATCYSRLGDLPAALGALGPDATSAANLAEAAGKRADLEALQERLNKVISTASAASSMCAAESALRELETLLAKDQAPFSSTLHRLRAQLLLQLGRREEAAEMCRVCSHVREPGLQPPPLWPWWLSVQCAFHSGDLKSAADQMDTLTAKYTAEGKESIAISDEDDSALAVADLTALAQQLRSLLKLKEAGNRAIKEGKGQEALQHYNAALTAELPGSAAFVAVLFANRAAAHQSLGQATHAVADCLRATALSPAYSKAHSRLATVLSELKHRTGEADVLERLQALPVATPSEAAAVAQRLRAARAAARTATPDHYKVIGIARDADAEEVRRAYKRSALQLHPDKALTQCRFSSRLGIHGALLVDTAQVQARVRDNADWLFKCVGAANAALSDTALRRQLDADLAAQEGRGYYSAYSSPSSSHYYSREADLFSRSRRKGAYNYGASFYESYQRRPRRPAGGYGAGNSNSNGHGGAAASDDSESEGFDFNNFY